MMNDAIRQLEAQRARAEKEIAAIDAAIKALKQLDGSLGSAKATKAAGKGGISAAGRARIAAAQRARWAKAKARKPAAKTAVTKAPQKKKAKISAAGIARIRAAQKARWAKVKAAKTAAAK